MWTRTAHRAAMEVHGLGPVLDPPLAASRRGHPRLQSRAINPWLGFTRTVSLFFYMIYGYRLPAAYKLLPSPRKNDPAGFSFARLILASVCSWITSNKFSQWQSKTLDYLRPSKSSSSSVVRCYAFAPNWQHRARKCFGIPRDLAFPAIKYIRPMLLYL